jgi:hypothetical protein
VVVPKVLRNYMGGKEFIPFVKTDDVQLSDKLDGTKL